MNLTKNEIKKQFEKELLEEKQKRKRVIIEILKRREEEYNFLIKKGVSYQERKLKGEIILYGKQELEKLKYITL